MGKKVIVKEEENYLECECPSDSCNTCRLRFKCYTSRPLQDLTFAEKMMLVLKDKRRTGSKEVIKWLKIKA